MKTSVKQFREGRRRIDAMPTTQYVGKLEMTAEHRVDALLLGMLTEMMCATGVGDHHNRARLWNFLREHVRPNDPLIPPAYVPFLNPKKKRVRKKD